MANFPDDVLRHVFSYLPQETLAQCRFLSRAVEPLARAFVFRQTRLEVDSDVELFLNIVRSERLRPYVRELTVDLSQEKRPVSDSIDYGAQVEQRRQALMAVPLVRLFSGLRTLNLRFSEAQNHGEDTTPQDSVPPTFSTVYTEKILQCISGCWTKESQDQWVRGWHTWSRSRVEALRNLMILLEPGDPDLLKESEQFGAIQQFPDSAINLSTLTISNLSEQDSEYLTSSATMRHFLETQSLSTLQLLTTSGAHASDTFNSEGPILQNRYRFLRNLPSTWLSPPIANRLRTLSLYAQEYWGWTPKMDLRALGGLPNLRTLALGLYVFTHQWQVDWVAELGSDNGRGGLEELYLDNCPILWRGRVPSPLDSEAFPLEEVMIERTYHPNREHVEVDVDLRWSTVLDEWRRRMPSLKVFRMGSGNWDGAYSTEIAMAQTASRAQSVRGAYLSTKHRAVDAMHVNYDKPPIEALYRHGQDAIQDGVGLSQRREFLLQYIRFEIALGSQHWVERDFKDALTLEFEDGYQRYEEARRRDGDALDALCASRGSHLTRGR